MGTTLNILNDSIADGAVIDLPVLFRTNDRMEQAVIFDLDETLFDRRGSLRLFLSDQFTQFSFGSFRKFDEVIERFMTLDNRGQAPKLEVYRTLVAEQGQEDEALASELFCNYEQNAWRFAFSFDGMDIMFKELNLLGFKTGIVSNGQTHIQLRSLLALNLDRTVDVFLISETEGIRKPEPEIFLRAARRLSVDPIRCIFVGDSPEADMVGAQQVGMKTIWFPNGAHWPKHITQQPDAVVHTLLDVSRVIRHWLSAS